MSEQEFSFDPTKHDASGNSALPAGDYLVAVQKAFVKQSKGNYNMISIEAQVVEGPRKGAKIFDNILVGHPKENVRKIAETSMSQIIYACKADPFKSLAQLVSKIAKIKVTVQKDDPDQNNVSRYYFDKEYEKNCKSSNGPAPTEKEDAPDSSSEATSSETPPNPYT